MIVADAIRCCALGRAESGAKKAGKRVRHPVALTAALSCILLAWCACAFALDPSLDISQYAHTSWKIRDGFTKGTITSIAQTPDGYLWLGTQFGLVRFDGIRAVPWQPPGGQRLPSDWIYSLLVSRDGTLWIGTHDGLTSWKDGKLTQYPELADFTIVSLFEDHEGTIWAPSITFGPSPPPVRLCAVLRGRAQCYGEGIFHQPIDSVYEDSAGNLLLGGFDGLWRWKPGPPQRYDASAAHQIVEDDTGGLIVGAADGLKKLVAGKLERYPLPGIEFQFTPEHLLRSSDGSVWIGTVEHGLLHLNGGRVDWFAQRDGLSGDNVHKIFQDHEGNIWTATGAGLDRFRDYAVATISSNQGLRDESVWSVLGARDGSVWLGSFIGLSRWKDGNVTVFSSPDSSEVRSAAELSRSAAKIVRFVNSSGLSGPGESLFEDRGGQIWATTSKGIVRWDGNRFAPVNGVPGSQVYAMAEDSEGAMWVGNSREGLFRVPHDGAVERIAWSRLGHSDYAYGMAVDPSRGGLWLGFYRGGVVYWKDGEVRSSFTPADGLGSGVVAQLRFGSRGTLWAATQSGLSRIVLNSIGLSRSDDGHISTLTSKNGLPCDTVHWSIEDDDHSVWLYMPCGLVQIAQSELDAWVSDPTRKALTTVYDVSDGVGLSTALGGYGPHVSKSPDGRIWFTAFGGVRVIDPHRLPFNKLPPPVHIEQISADGKTYDPANGLQLPPRVRDLTVDYTALSFVAPEKIHFRYKLEGQDPVWREVVNDRQVQYSNLAPRHYTFRVMASNNSGVWNETGASLEFSVLPAFYQTNWFRLLCVTAFVGLLWAVYRLRLHQMQRQFAFGLEARVGERLRIARELHDTLLQSFQGVAFQLQAARKLILRKADNAEEVLDDAILATEEAIREGRSAIRDLRPEPAAQRNLSELLDAAGRELATAAELNGQAPIYRVLVEGKQQSLSPMLQDEVYRISREVIRNAFAHAAASHIEVEVRYEQDHLRLRVRDDGKGIDPKTLQAGGESGHFGIPGMRERAQRIGARLDFWSEIGAGSEVELTVPASMAYQGPRNGHRFRLFHWAGRDEQRS
jgi:signal transduction histidine kinase/ligand-binding sensor domain-containing protein